MALPEGSRKVYGPMGVGPVIVVVKKTSRIAESIFEKRYHSKIQKLAENIAKGIDHRLEILADNTETPEVLTAGNKLSRPKYLPYEVGRHLVVVDGFSPD